MHKYVLLLVSIALAPVMAQAQTYYECVVASDSTKGGICAEFGGYTHRCQLYDGYNGVGIPSHCSDYCVGRSDIPSDCVIVTVVESINPEAHEARADIQAQIPIDINSEAMQDIANEVRGRLAGIENEINTEDGIDSAEIQHVVGRVVAVIQDILREQFTGWFTWSNGDDSQETKSENTVPVDTSDEKPLSDEELEALLLDDGLDGTKPGAYRFEKWPDENGTTIAKIVDAYGVERYTSDGKHYYNSPYDAAHSGEGLSWAYNGVKDTVASIDDWFWTTEDTDKEKQLQVDIAREVLTDTKAQSEKDIEKAYDKLSGAIDVPMFGDVPAKAVVAVAKELPAADFASAAVVYIQEREKGNSPASIRENNSEVLSEGYGTFGNQGALSLSTANKYADAVLYARYEEVYQRYIIAKQLGRTQ